MTEFAIVAPILFFFLLGVLESGLLLFVVGSARWGVAEVARQESESGSAVTADQDSITVLRKTAIGTTTLSTVNEIDIFHLTENVGTGQLTIDPLRYNKYKLDGSCFSTGIAYPGPCPSNTYPPASRSVRNLPASGQPDFLGILLKYQYNWKTGVFLASSPLQMTQLYEIRLEPQTY